MRARENLYRQGDVLIAAVHCIPDSAVRRDGFVLAYGELTGHSHRLENPSTAELFESDGSLYLRVTAEVARVAHEEHRPIILPRGQYVIWLQREYTPHEVTPLKD